jgi:hypothetical protein
MVKENEEANNQQAYYLEHECRLALRRFYRGIKYRPCEGAKQQDHDDGHISDLSVLVFCTHLIVISWVKVWGINSLFGFCVRQLNQIPEIAVQIFKNRHNAVRRFFGLPDKFDAI